MAQSFPDIEATQAWVDITTLPTHAAIKGKTVLIVAKNGSYNRLWFGGAQAPDPRDGMPLAASQSYTGTADNIWVRGDGRFAIVLED